MTSTLILRGVDLTNPLFAYMNGVLAHLLYVGGEGSDVQCEVDLDRYWDGYLCHLEIERDGHRFESTCFDVAPSIAVDQAASTMAFRLMSLPHLDLEVGVSG